FVDGIAQRSAAGSHGRYRAAQRLHAEDVEALTAHVLLAHVDLTGQTKQGRGRGASDAVLTGSRLGDDARLAHAAGEERLADRVVDLVCAGVIEVFALEKDASAAGFLSQALREVQG